MIWILVGYMWLFLHRPFEVWPILGTIRLERLYMAFTLISWAVLGKKEWTENRVNLGIFGLAAAIFVSSLMSPYLDFLDNGDAQNWFKVLVFFFLIMSTVKKEKDLKILVSAFIFCFFLYMLHSYREYLNGKGKWAMDTWRMVGVDATMNDPNTYGNSIVYALPMLFPLVTLIKKKWQWIFPVAYFLLSLRCIQLTGSRSSMIALLAFLGCSVLLSRHRMKIIPVVLLSLPILWFSLNENLKERYTTIWDSSLNEGATSSARGRLDGFWDGLDNFTKSPIWGVGPGCHGIATGKGLYSHNLYGEVMGEEGAIGTLSLLALVSAVFLNHKEARERYQSLKRLGREKDGLYCYRVSFAVVGAYGLLLLLGWGGHNLLRYTWLWYAAFQAIATSILRERDAKLRFVKSIGGDLKTVSLES